MAKQRLRAGETSRSVYVFIQDSSATDGSGLSGLTNASSGLTARYVRPRAAPADITLAAQTETGAYSSGGFVEMTSNPMPGLYRLDLPDAALAAGAEGVIVMLFGATNMAPVLLEIQLDDMSEPAAGSIPADEDMPLEQKVNWILKVALGELISDSVSQTIRNRADTQDLATNTISDAAGTTTRGQFS